MPTRERTGVICRSGSDVLAIEQQDPASLERFWTFPGGALEAGETPAQCAVRETLEETGYRVKLTSDAWTNEYRFKWNGKVYECTTHWFLAETTGEPPGAVDDADYILQAAWLPWPASRALFAFNKGLIDATTRLLDT